MDEGVDLLVGGGDGVWEDGAFGFRWCLTERSDPPVVGDDVRSLILIF